MQNNLDYFFVTENTRISHAVLTSFYTIFVLATMGPCQLISVLKDSYCEFLIHFALQLGYKPNATVLKNYLYGRRDYATPNTLR